MCTYARTVYACHHEVWGRRVKACEISEEYQNSDLPMDCAIRQPHGLQSRRLAQKCDKCASLEETVAAVRAKLEECRQIFNEKFPEHRIEKEEVLRTVTNDAPSSSPSASSDADELPGIWAMIEEAKVFASSAIVAVDEALNLERRVCDGQDVSQEPQMNEKALGKCGEQMEDLKLEAEDSHPSPALDMSTVKSLIIKIRDCQERTTDAVKDGQGDIGSVSDREAETLNIQEKTETLRIQEKTETPKVQEKAEAPKVQAETENKNSPKAMNKTPKKTAVQSKLPLPGHRSTGLKK